MTDKPLDDHEARKCFVADLVEIDAQGPALDGDGQRRADLAEHEASAISSN